MSRLTRDGTAEPVSRDQIVRRERGRVHINFPCSADHKQGSQPYPLNPHCCYMCDHTYIHTKLIAASIFYPASEGSIYVSSYHVQARRPHHRMIPPDQPPLASTMPTSSLMPPMTLLASSDNLPPARDAMGVCNPAGIQDSTSPLLPPQNARARKEKNALQRRDMCFYNAFGLE